MPGLMTPSESKQVGWDGPRIDTFPTAERVEGASRTELVNWHRNLRVAESTEEDAILVLIQEHLKNTYPA